MKVKIDEMCNKRGITLYKLARIVGVSWQCAYLWGEGRTQPGWHNFDRICSALECTMDDLLEAEGTPKKDIIPFEEKVFW